MSIIKVPETQEPPSSRVGVLLRAFARVLMKILPQASPDYDDGRVDLVAYWLVEIDEDGYPMREIGFTAQDEPILFAPTTRNYGLWTDSDRVFSWEQFETVHEFPFDATWKRLLESTKQVAL